MQENIEYEIAQTPCEYIINKGLPEGFDSVDKLFPDFKILSTEKFVSYLGVPLKDSKGEIIGIIVVMSRGAFQNKLVVESIINIFSVRASAELERDYYIAALKGSEKKFKDLATNSPDLIYIIDTDIKRAIYFNRDNILGYSREELSISEGWLHIVHPDDAKLVEEHWSLFLKSTQNEAKHIEYRIKNKEGVYEWVINRHVVIERNAESKPKLVLLNLTIITERKNAENALKESESKLTALIENTNDVMWSVDTNFVFTAMNSACKNIFKNFFNVDIKVGDSLLDSLPEYIKIECLSLHRQTLKGEIISKEFNIKRKSQTVSYEMSYYPIHSDKGVVSGVSVFARDITQRKIAENDIIRTNFELDSFVYRASHDLRAPLRSVLGLINLVKTEPDEYERNSYLSLVEKSVDKLDTFISDLTNFSRNSRMQVVVQAIDFNSIINDCLENLKYMDNADRIKTNIIIKDNFQFYSDITRISIVIQNIISNAIKYQNHRKENSFVDITIFNAGDYAEINIVDNGRGIKEEYIEKIFDMFFRASQESYGSGLGLYIVKQVVEKLNGTIRVTSKLGIGTEFTLRLPNLKEKILK